jgi:hypothetical protein
MKLLKTLQPINGRNGFIAIFLTSTPSLESFAYFNVKALQLLLPTNNYLVST